MSGPPERTEFLGHPVDRVPVTTLQPGDQFFLGANYVAFIWRVREVPGPVDGDKYHYMPMSVVSRAHVDPPTMKNLQVGAVYDYYAPQGSDVFRLLHPLSFMYDDDPNGI